MPIYCVPFSTPVIYQPDHPRVTRTITELQVIAETPEHAKQHAIKVTQGDGLAGDPVEIVTP